MKAADQDKTPKKLLTYADLAAMGLKYSPNHLRTMIKAGRFPQPVKLLGDAPSAHVVFLATEIDEWIDRRTRAYREKAKA